MRGCWEAVLDALARLERRHGRREFDLADIVAEVAVNDPQSRRPRFGRT